MSEPKRYPGVRILPSGTISYYIREPDHDGTYHQHTVTRDRETDEPFTSEYQASRARARHQAKIDAGHRPRSRELLSTYAAAWLVSRRDVKPSSRRTYAYAIDHITRHIGSIALRDLRPSDVRRLHDALSDAGLAPSSRNLIHTTLGMLLDAALTDELIERNPARLVKAPSTGKPEVEPWEAEEVRRFLAVSDRHHAAAFWRIALETGMRVGELRALTWGDVNWQESYVSVRRTATVDDAGRQIIGDSPKSDSGRRSVPLSTVAVEQLRTRHRVARSTLIFPNKRGNLIGPQTLRDWFGALCETANVPPIRLHDMRHTAATMMLNQGVPVHVVSGILGHASPTITLSVYAHLLPSSARDAVDAMARYIEG